MQPITFPLRLGDTGSQIVNLQKGLFFLLRQNWFQVGSQEQERMETTLLKEQQRQFFSDNATYELVKRFQERMRLQPREEGVDRATAEALNKILIYDEPLNF